MDVDAFFRDYSKVFAQADQEAISAFLQEHIATAEAEGDKHALVTILNEAAGYFRNASRYPEAIAAGEKALALLKELGYEDSIAHGTTLLNVATAYRAAGNLAKAMELFISALAALGSLLPADDHRLAALYNNISGIHQEQENWQAAFEMLVKAARIMEKQPEMAEDAAIVLTNLGMILFRLDRAEEASAALNKAEGMFRLAAAQNGEGQRPAPHYAAALAGLGEAYFRLGEFEKSAQTYEAALEHIKNAFGENRDFAVTCYNCADAWEAAGQDDKAQALRSKAEAILAEAGASS